MPHVQLANYFSFGQSIPVVIAKVPKVDLGILEGTFGFDVEPHHHVIRTVFSIQHGGRWRFLAEDDFKAIFNLQISMSRERREAYCQRQECKYEIFH